MRLAFTRARGRCLAFSRAVRSLTLTRQLIVIIVAVATGPGRATRSTHRFLYAAIATMRAWAKHTG